MGRNGDAPTTALESMAPKSITIILSSAVFMPKDRRPESLIKKRAMINTTTALIII